jgi:hypothetical protein
MISSKAKPLANSGSNTPLALLVARVFFDATGSKFFVLPMFTGCRLLKVLKF